MYRILRYTSLLIAFASQVTLAQVKLSGEKLLNFKGLTGNERLYLIGLMKEFDKANVADKLKAKWILEALKFDKLSIAGVL